LDGETREKNEAMTKTEEAHVAALVFFSAVLCIVCALFGLAFGTAKGDLHARSEERQKAIDAGVGRWTIDPATGERKFEYGGKP